MHVEIEVTVGERAFDPHAIKREMKLTLPAGLEYLVVGESKDERAPIEKMVTRILSDSLDAFFLMPHDNEKRDSDEDI